MRTLAMLVLWGAAAPAIAGDFTVEPITITVPAGFDGPIQQQQQAATVVGFTKGGGSAKTLLQISLYDIGSQLKGLSKAESASASRKYLLEFVSGVEQRRTNFKRTEPAPVKIGGLSAAKLQWTGELQGMKTVGVMYCFVVGTKIISFHTQDLGSAPTETMNEAIEAFEAARVNHGG